MHPLNRTFAFLIGCFVFSGCATTPKGRVSPVEKPIEEKLIWSSQDRRPEWSINEPYSEGEFLLFVGLSDKLETEKEAREDAQQAAINNVVKYIGVDVKDKFQKIQTSYGLSTDIIDPAVATRRLEEHLSAAVARKVKAREWYIERWKWKYRTHSQYCYSVFVLCQVPKEEPDKVIQEQIKRQQEILEAAKSANDKLAELNNRLLDAGQMASSEYDRKSHILNQVIKEANELKSKLTVYSELSAISEKVESVINGAQNELDKMKEQVSKRIAVNITSLKVDASKIKIAETELINKLTEKGYEAILVESTESGQLKNKVSKLMSGTLSTEYLGDKIELPGGKIVDYVPRYRAQIDIRIIDVNSDTSIASKNESQEDFGKTKDEAEEKAIKKVINDISEYIIEKLE